MSQQLKNAPPRKTRPVIVKMTPEEFALIHTKSMKWAGGNVSAFLREAGKSWTPGKADLIEVADPETARPKARPKQAATL